MKVGIIGVGNIGLELRGKLGLLDWDVEFVLKSDGVYKNEQKIDVLENYLSYCESVDVVFLAIPTSDDGKVASDYIYNIVNKNIPVVTCEKGALSNYYSRLEPYLDKIGYSASVGGGTRLLNYAETMMSEDVTSMHLIVNGTLNYIFEQMSKDESIGEAVKNAQRLGYVEPGATDILDIINGEACSDVPMKISILHNVCGLGKPIKAKDIKVKKISKIELEQLIDEAHLRRYVVSFRKNFLEEDGVIGGFVYKSGEWNICAGFKDISKNKIYMQLKSSEVNNAILITKGVYNADGIYKLKGPGAGAGPTTSSMIKDALTFFK